MPEEVYVQVKAEIPYGVGVYVPDRLHHGKDWYDLKSVKNAKRKNREKSLTEMLFYDVPVCCQGQKRVVKSALFCKTEVVK